MSTENLGEDAPQPKTRRAWFRQLWVQVLAATLSTIGSIPVTSVALILGVHRLLAEGLVPTNLIGNAVATIAISKWEDGLDEAQMQRVLNRE